MVRVRSSVRCEKCASFSGYPTFLEDIIWEKEYRKSEWKAIPYRKTITEFFKKIDEQVLVPVNLGVYASIKEAKRVLAEGCDRAEQPSMPAQPISPCSTIRKSPVMDNSVAQYSFMVNFALIEMVAKHLGMTVSRGRATKGICRAFYRDQCHEPDGFALHASALLCAKRMGARSLDSANHQVP